MLGCVSKVVIDVFSESLARKVSPILHILTEQCNQPEAIRRGHHILGQFHHQVDFTVSEVVSCRTYKLGQEAYRLQPSNSAQECVC